MATRLFSRERKTLFAEWWWTIDRELLAALVLLLLIGVGLSFAASPPVAERIGQWQWHFVVRHIPLALGALVVMLATSLLSARHVRWIALAVLVGSVFALLLTFRFGVEIKGARRWLSFMSLSVQPSEFVKPAFAIIAAWLFSESMSRGDVPGRILAGGLMVLIVIPLLLQPDVGQTALMVMTYLALLFLAGMSWWLIIVLGLGGMGLALGAYFIFPHVARRVDSFLDPSSGDNYQVDKALQSLLEGGWFGRGVGEGLTRRVLPDAHADYVFAAAAGEFGILFCLVLVGVIGFIVLRGLGTAQRQSNLFARLAASTLAIQFGLQSAINLAVNVNLIPPKGMTLPFVSYGGTSLIAVAFGMGAMLALSRKRPEEKYRSGLPAFRTLAAEGA